MRFIDQFQGKNDQILLVGEANSIGQTFISEKSNLSGIRLYLSNPKLGGSNLFLITIAKNNQIVRQETFSESNVGWDMTFRFDFEPIISNPRDKFRLNISTLDSDRQDISDLTLVNLNRSALRQNSKNYLSNMRQSELDSKYLHVTYSLKDAYSKGSAVLENSDLPGDIVFETYYSTDIKTATANLAGNTITRLKADSSFSIFYLLMLLIFLLAGIVVALRNLEGKAETV